MLLLNLRNRLFLYSSGTARCFQWRHAKRLECDGRASINARSRSAIHCEMDSQSQAHCRGVFQRRKSFQFSEFCEAGSNRVVGSTLAVLKNHQIDWRQSIASPSRNRGCMECRRRFSESRANSTRCQDKLKHGGCGVLMALPGSVHASRAALSQARSESIPSVCSESTRTFQIDSASFTLKRLGIMRSALIGLRLPTNRQEDR